MKIPFQRSFVPSATGLWNGLPEKVVELEPQKFKHSCSAIIKDSIPLFFQVYLYFY